VSRGGTGTLAETLARGGVCMVLSGGFFAACGPFPNPGGAANDQTGFSVGISGDTAIVGVPKSGGDNAGKALVYQRSGTAWGLQATLIPDTPSYEAAFGWSVAISGDRAIVGAFTDSAIGYISGAAYIFERTGTTWTQAARLLGDSEPEVGLGQSVAISGDYAVVGAPLPPATTFTGPGHAYVYRRDSGTGVWLHDATLIASDAVDFIDFGTSVSVDKDVIAVGAERGVEGGVVGGAVYVFRRTGGVWNEEAKLTASDAAYHDLFGASVSVSGNRILVGAKEDDDMGDASGSAYIFAYDDGTSTWLEAQKLTANNGTEGDNFGRSVSISGGRAIVGAWLGDGPGSTTGAAYTYRTVGSDFDLANTLFKPDGAYGDGFGFSVAISGDCAAVGAVNDDVDGLPNVGSAYYSCGLPGPTFDKIVVDIICCVQIPDPAGPVIVTTRIANNGERTVQGRRWVEAIGRDGTSAVLVEPKSVSVAPGRTTSERLAFHRPAEIPAETFELLLVWQDASGILTAHVPFRDQGSARTR
jgi:hypothetical protein